MPPARSIDRIASEASSPASRWMRSSSTDRRSISCAWAETRSARSSRKDVSSHMALADVPVRELLAAFSSPDPTPGGGSASALASAIGASLLVMVGSLAKTRTGAPEERTALDAAARTLAEVRDRLAAAIDADAAAYDRVVAAY